MEWQPIETAPKSALMGQVLTFRRYIGEEDSYPACLEKRLGPWFQTSRWSPYHEKKKGWPLNVQPTHWMPLPPPPKD